MGRLRLICWRNGRLELRRIISAATNATTLAIPPFLAYDQPMRYLAAITMLVLVMAQPVATQNFKPDFKAGHAGWGQKDYATAEYTWLVTKMADRTRP